MMSGAVLALSSCTKDVVENSSFGQEATASFTIDGIKSASTRAAYADPQKSNMRLVVMVSHDNKVVTSKTIAGWDGNSEKFDFRLVTGQEYSVAAWADFGDNFYTVTGDEEDEYGKAPSVSLTDNVVDGSLNTNDAYFAIKSLQFNTTGGSESLILKRPFGLVRVVTNDAGENAVENAGLNPTKYETSINVPTSLDLLTAVAGNPQDVKFAGNVAQNHVNGETEQELSFDYIFASPTGELLTYDVDYFAGTTKVLTYSYENIPVQRNYKTDMSGNILTKSGTLNIEVDQDWDGSVSSPIAEVTSITDIKTALASATTVKVNTEVTGTSNTILIPDNSTEPIYNIVLEKGVESSGQTVITVEDSDYTGKINIVIPKGVSNNQIETLIIDCPKATVTVDGITVKNMTMGTSGSTCIITANTEITGLATVERGNVDVYGKVASITRNAKVTADNPKTTVRVMPDGSATLAEDADKKCIALASINAGIVLRSTGVNYSSISAAIQAVPVGGKDEIMLSAGVYPESVNISHAINGKNITISGPNKGIAGGEATRVEEADIQSHFYRAPTLTNDFTLTLDGVKLSGKAVIEIEGGGVNFTMKNSLVTTKGTIARGPYVIYCQSAKGASSTFTLEDNKFAPEDESVCNSIYLWACKKDNSSMTTVLKGNEVVRTVANLGTGGKVGNAIFTVDGNTFDNVDKSEEKSALMLTGGGANTSYTVTGNKFSNAKCAFYVYDQGALNRLVESENTYNNCEVEKYFPEN